MAGRKPKPNAIKELHGNPGKRALNKREPKFGGIAKCPPHLSKVAKQEWKRVSQELADSGLLTSVDRAALAGYCSSWARWVDAEDHLNLEGAVVKGVTGTPVRNPYAMISDHALDQLRKFAVEFGMTPSSRSRIHVETPTVPADPFDDFMNSAMVTVIDVTPEESSTDDSHALCAPRD